jgi:hypothetical protein
MISPEKEHFNNHFLIKNVDGSLICWIDSDYPLLRKIFCVENFHPQKVWLSLRTLIPHTIPNQFNYIDFLITTNLPILTLQKSSLPCLPLQMRPVDRHLGEYWPKLRIHRDTLIIAFVAWGNSRPQGYESKMDLIQLVRIRSRRRSSPIISEAWSILSSPHREPQPQC